jgi:hypothetical protein
MKMCWERMSGTETMKAKRRVVACILGSVGCVLKDSKKYFDMSLAEQRVFEEHSLGKEFWAQYVVEGVNGTVLVASCTQ